MKKLFFTIVTFLMAICFAQTGWATIMYSVTDNTGPNYGLAFDVKNDSGFAVTSFDIFFGDTSDGLNFTDGDQFNNFLPGSQPAGWSSYSFEPQAFDDPGFFGSIDTGALAIGASVTGFNVTFNWTGTGSYDHLWYILYDENYAEVETGYTALKDPGQQVVPEPTTLLLFGFGLLGTAIISRKKRG